MISAAKRGHCIHLFSAQRWAPLCLPVGGRQHRGLLLSAWLRTETRGTTGVTSARATATGYASMRNKIPGKRS